MKREPGFYWVRLGERWMICHYDESGWDADLAIKVSDGYFTEIDEKQIKRE